MPSKRVAVDLGSATARVLEIAKSGDGVQVVAGGRLPLRANPNLPPDRLRALQLKGLERVFERTGVSSRRVVAGVSGQSAFIRNIKLPPIPESRVDQIVRYEVQQTIPFRLDEIAVDYQMLRQQNAAEMEVVLVAMKGDVCEQFIKQLEEVRVKTGLLDANPLAIYNAYVYSGYSNEADCTAILDFGATTTTILIEYDGHLRFTRCVGLGGNDISQLLANELGKSFDEAEMIKMQAGLLFPPPGPNAKVSEEHRKISTILARAIDRLLGEVKLSIGYFRTQSGAVAVSRAFICGGGAQMKNIRPLIADRLGVQVAFLNPFRSVEVPPEQAALKRQGLEFVTVMGHALRGLVPCAIEISLEPPRLVARRQRQVQGVCYGLSLLFLIGATYFGGQLLTPNIERDRQMLTKYEETLAPFEAQEKERAALAEEVSILTEEYALLMRSARGGIPALLYMRMLSENMHPGLFVETLRTDRKKGEVHLTGYADTGNVDENYGVIYDMTKAFQGVSGLEPKLQRREMDDTEDARVSFRMTVYNLPKSLSAYQTKLAAYRERETAPPVAATDSATASADTGDGPAPEEA